jgi:membrane protein YdbS with pleckstrin-like domain
MFCDECGAENKDTAAYCRKCGVNFEHEISTTVSRRGDVEEETRLATPRFRREAAQPVVPLDASGSRDLERQPPADRPSDIPGENEREIFSISPTLLFVKIGYGLSILGALLLVALITAFAGSLVSTSLAVMLGLALLLIPAYKHLMTRFVRYTLTDRTLRIDEGVVARSTRNIPLRRIQDVTVSSSITQRLLGLGNLVVDNASEEGGKIVLRNIDDPRARADNVLQQIAKVER